MVYTAAVLDIEKVRAYYAAILPFYEREVAARADLPFWQALARRWRPARILEIGCGTGSVARALSKRAPAIGIDISWDLLRRARRHRGAARAVYVQADFRESVFRRSFDLIVAPRDPLSHLTSNLDRRRALCAVARQLAPEGRFVLDALLRREGSAVTIERKLRDREGELRIREDWRPLTGRGLWRAAYTYGVRSPDGAIARTEASFLARAWDPEEIRSEFSSCGLAVDETWGDYSCRRFGPRSRRLIIVARQGH